MGSRRVAQDGTDTGQAGQEADRLVLVRKKVEAFDRKGEISELSFAVKNLDELCCLGIVCTDAQWEKLVRRSKEIGIHFVAKDGKQTEPVARRIGYKGTWCDTVKNCHYLVTVGIVGPADVVITMPTDLAEAVAGEGTEIIITKSPIQTIRWW
ncbi:hypothetical protein AYO47_03475 [Planctomyces sp. SCGC AG-212-M04]|nr:hypothetical protein AYO47_03475 [Planctomyces sp. SCGC AG-212-M04]